MPLSKYFTIHYLFDYTTEESTKVALVNLIFFTIYLIGVTAIGITLTAERNYVFNRDMKIMFSRPYRTRNDTISLEKVISITDFWNYMHHVVMQIFHGSVYDLPPDRPPHMVNYRPSAIGNVFLNNSILVGPPRLRQIRVKNSSCPMNYAFQRYFRFCVGEYSSSSILTNAYYKGTKYMTFNELEATPITASLHTYYHGGYVQPLTYTAEVNRGILRHLRQIKWFDRRTRLILFEFNVFNMNFGLYNCVKLIFEVPPTGLLNVKYSSDIVGVQLYHLDRLNWLVTICIVMSYALNFYFTYVEIKRIYAHGIVHYLKNAGLWLPLSRILVIYYSLFFEIYFPIRLEALNKDITAAKNAQISLDRIVFMHRSHRIAIAVLLCFSWIGLLNFMDFNPVLRTFRLAMHMASSDLYAFTIMFLILFTAYGNLGLLLFGGENDNFRDFFTSFLTMMHIVGGVFDYFALETKFQITGSIFFMTYVMIIFFVLKNMFFAIVVLSYRTATSSVGFKPSFLWYFIRKQLYRVSNGFFPAPDYPDWSVTYQNVNEMKLQQLQMYMDYTELEYDINLLFNRLDIIETIFYRLTNDLEDLIAKVKRGK